MDDAVVVAAILVASYSLPRLALESDDPDLNGIYEANAPVIGRGEKDPRGHVNIRDKKERYYANATIFTNWVGVAPSSRA